MKEKPVGEEIVRKNGCMTVYRRYYRGELAGGKWIKGYTGRETVFIENELKPIQHNSQKVST